MPPPTGTRVVTACQKCRKRKTKCDRNKPCSTCRKLKVECVYMKMPSPKANVEPKRSSVLQTPDSPMLSSIASKFGVLEIEEGNERFHQDISMQFFGFPQLLNQISRRHAQCELGLNRTPNSLCHQSPSLASISNSKTVPVSEFSDLIISYLPPRESVDVLLKQFFTFKTYSRYVIQEDVFYTEYNEFWTASEIDPFFLALLFALISMTTISTEKETKVVSGRELNSKKATSNASMECLKRGKFFERYCLKGLQAMIINMTYFWLDINSFINAGMMVSVAHGLGLHRDPTNVQGLDFSEYEFRRRLWCIVLIIDVQFTCVEGLPLHLVPAETDTLSPTYSPDVDGDTDQDRKHFQFTIFMYHLMQIWASVHRATRALQPPGYERISHIQNYIFEMDSAAAQLLMIDEDEPDASFLWEACVVESSICRGQLTLHLSFIATHSESKRLALNAAIRTMRCFLILNGRRSEDLERHKWRGYYWMIRCVLIAALLSALLATSEALPEEKEIWQLVQGAHQLLCKEEMNCYIGQDFGILNVIEQLWLERLVNYDVIKDIHWEWVQAFQ